MANDSEQTMFVNKELVEDLNKYLLVDSIKYQGRDYTPSKLGRLFH